jgi:hypothetical protein
MLNNPESCHCTKCGKRSPVGYFEDRTAWLRRHYKKNHPRAWKRSVAKGVATRFENRMANNPVAKTSTKNYESWHDVLVDYTFIAKHDVVSPIDGTLLLSKGEEASADTLFKMQDLGLNLPSYLNKFKKNPSLVDSGRTTKARYDQMCRRHLAIPDQLAIGTREEMEHKDTINYLRKHPGVTVRKAAEMIAKDHLAEDPEYYTKLEMVEGKSNPVGVDKIFSMMVTKGVNLIESIRAKAISNANVWRGEFWTLYGTLTMKENSQFIKEHLDFMDLMLTKHPEKWTAEDCETGMDSLLKTKSNPGPMSIFELRNRIGRGQRAMQERVLDTLIPEDRGKQGLVEDTLPFQKGLKRNPRKPLEVIAQVNAILNNVESNRQEDDDAPHGNWFARTVGEIEGLLESLTYKERKANSGQIADFDERIQKISRGELKLIIAPLAEDFEGAYTTLKQNPAPINPTAYLASILLESHKMLLVGKFDEHRALNAQAAQLTTSMTTSEKNEAYRIYRKLLKKVGGN